VSEAAPCVTCFEAGTEFVLGEISVTSFLTPHDTPESVGYRFFDGKRSLVFVTDIGCVTRTVLDAVLGADMAVIEANHDLVMLKNGPYPAYLKRRILSEHGHLSNDDSGRLATRLAETGTRRIVLAHLSKENNTPRLAFDTVGGALKSRGAVVGGDVELETAPADTMGRIYIL
jgi:phosphoribosyl 1,2-cyclic phosphodiesterase